jgi:mannose-6-phosphate isomerase-like protein (cupin superfamily)
LDLEETRELRWAGGAMRARVGVERGNASLGLLFVGPAQDGLEHEHAGSWEIVGLLRGSGSTDVGAAPGPPSTRGLRLQAGRVLAIPPGARHRSATGASEEMLAVQLYVPPGPEQRFKTLTE